MADLAELVVAGALAVAVNLGIVAFVVALVCLVPLVRRALDPLHQAWCRVFGGGYGLVGHSRPRQKAPLRRAPSPQR
jgi:hypothetical protein